VGPVRGCLPLLSRIRASSTSEQLPALGEQLPAREASKPDSDELAVSNVTRVVPASRLALACNCSDADVSGRTQIQSRGQQRP
jgi:hypothetical protein